MPLLCLYRGRALWRRYGQRIFEGLGNGRFFRKVTVTVGQQLEERDADRLQRGFYLMMLCKIEADGEAIREKMIA